MDIDPGVLGHWGDCVPVRRLRGGNRNTAVLVRRGDELLVAKSTARSEAAVRWVADVQGVARSIGFVVPEFVPAQDGRLVVGSMTLERWVEGAVLGDPSGIGDLLAAFHERTSGWDQRPDFASSVELLTRSGGGDVDLEAMPEEVVEACRRCWRRIEDEDSSVVHGDLAPDNVLRTPDGRWALIDWDESRSDLSILDMAGLLETNPGYPEATWAAAKGALDAWEVAASWQREPGYARERARRLPFL